MYIFTNKYKSIVDEISPSIWWGHPSLRWPPCSAHVDATELQYIHCRAQATCWRVWLFSNPIHTPCHQHLLTQCNCNRTLVVNVSTKEHVTKTTTYYSFSNLQRLSDFLKIFIINNHCNFYKYSMTAKSNTVETNEFLLERIRSAE